MKYVKECKCCGKQFETNNPQKLYCNDDHYLPCPICGKLVKKTDNDFSRPPKCCSPECSHKLRQSKFKRRKCILCGKLFTPKSGVQTVCDDTHYDNCEICGKSFVRTLDNLRSNVTTCSPECTNKKLINASRKKYGTDHPMQSKEVQKHFHDAMMSKYGVAHALQIPGKTNKQQQAAYKTNMAHNGLPYDCMLPQCTEAQGHIVSKINKGIANRLTALGLDVCLEMRINDLSYDICIESKKTLIEIDPSYTHSTIPNHWGMSRDKYYHRDKSQTALDNGYQCIHVFDWDDIDKIVNMLCGKKRIYARNCKIYKLIPAVADTFLNDYHLQGTCRGQLLHLGLVYQGKLYQVMTFGKSRYDKSYDVELLRLCTLPGYTVIGGASRLFSYATSEFGLNNIISYCDRSKFSGNVYEKIGMKFVRNTPPQEIWSKGSSKITANLLRQRGYDQLFGTNYGKGVSNNQLMLENGWLPIYDCGQAVYEFK